MFTPHFNMSHQPFPERIDVDHILKDDQFTQGLAKLRFMMETGSIALVTGSTGVGKSTLIRSFVSGLKQAQAMPVYIHLTQVKAPSLLSSIVFKLGETPRRGKDRLFRQILQKAGKNQQTTLLILDEAHLLCNEVLTDLRLMISSAMDNEPPFKMILLGQEPLRRQLRQEQHADFVNRVTVHVKLRTLSVEQCAAYIDFQMKCSGASEKIFDDEVKQVIHDFTNGIPRQVNNVATGCLIVAATNKVQKIDVGILKTVMDEFSL